MQKIIKERHAMFCMQHVDGIIPSDNNGVRNTCSLFRKT